MFSWLLKSFSMLFLGFCSGLCLDLFGFARFHSCCPDNLCYLVKGKCFPRCLCVLHLWYFQFSQTINLHPCYLNTIYNLPLPFSADICCTSHVRLQMCTILPWYFTAYLLSLISDPKVLSKTLQSCHYHFIMAVKW